MQLNRMRATGIAGVPAASAVDVLTTGMSMRFRPTYLHPSIRGRNRTRSVLNGVPMRHLLVSWVVAVGAVSEVVSDARLVENDRRNEDGPHI